MRKEFIDQLLMKAQIDRNTILISGDLGFGVIEEFQNTVPQQFVNSGITEQSSVSYAAGLAKSGFRTFFYSIGNFSTLRALEQIRNDISFMELPVTIVAIGAGFAYGTAGYSHHLIEDFGALSAFDLDIYSPTMPNNVEKCLEAIFAQRRPAYLRLGKGGERNFDISENVYDFPGKLSEIPRSDWTILVNSAILEEVVEAVKRMRREGSNAVILSCWKSNNFSGDEIEFLKNCKRLVVVEEHVIRGGFGSYICEILDMAPNRIAKRGISKVDKHLIGSTRYMRENYGLNSEQLFNFFMNL